MYVGLGQGYIGCAPLSKVSSKTTSAARTICICIPVLHLDSTLASFPGLPLHTYVRVKGEGLGVRLTLLSDTYARMAIFLNSIHMYNVDQRPHMKCPAWRYICRNPVCTFAIRCMIFLTRTHQMVCLHTL